MLVGNLRPREFLEAQKKRANYDIELFQLKSTALMFIGFIFLSPTVSLEYPDLSVKALCISAILAPIILVPFLSLKILKKHASLYHNNFRDVLIENSLLARILEQPEILFPAKLLDRVSVKAKLRNGKHGITIQGIFFHLSRRFSEIAQTYGVEAEFECPSLPFQLNLALIAIVLLVFSKGILAAIPSAAALSAPLTIQIIFSTLILYNATICARHAGLRLAICDAFLE